MSNSGKRRGRGRGSFDGGKQFSHQNPLSEKLSRELDDEDNSLSAANENSTLIQMFRQFQTELDERHDKFERLVKISRDVTIESKRIIFLLHRITSDESKEKILAEVKEKMDELRSNKWLKVALELKNEDPFQFIRAYSAGLQEYIEALSFFHYFEKRPLLSSDQLQQQYLTFPEYCKDDDLEDQKLLSVYVPPTEYILGLADLTGEMMRMAISCIGCGEYEKPLELCQLIRSLHNAFLCSGNHSREMSVKLAVLRQSLRKVEDACYALKVRGSEMPKHLLMNAFNSITVQPFSCDTMANDDCCAE